MTQGLMGARTPFLTGGSTVNHLCIFVGLVIVLVVVLRTR
jgi:hypothetical protein